MACTKTVLEIYQRDKTLINDPNLIEDFSKTFLSTFVKISAMAWIVAVVMLLFYVHGKHLRSCRDGQLT